MTKAATFTLTDATVKKFRIDGTWVDGVVLKGTGLATPGIRPAILDKNKNEITRKEGDGSDNSDEYIVRVGFDPETKSEMEFPISVKVSKAKTPTSDYYFAVTNSNELIREGAVQGKEVATGPSVEFAYV